LYVRFGSVFLNTRWEIAHKEKNLPSGFLNDWKIIEEWLGCSGREISKNDEKKFGNAWKAYLARGIAPSYKTNTLFLKVSKIIKEEGFPFEKYLPPENLLGVFDRMRATNAEIAEKQKNKEELHKMVEVYKIAEAYKTEIKNNKNNVSKKNLKSRISKIKYPALLLFSLVFTITLLFAISLIDWNIYGNERIFAGYKDGYKSCIDKRDACGGVVTNDYEYSEWDDAAFNYIIGKDGKDECKSFRCNEEFIIFETVKISYWEYFSKYKYFTKYINLLLILILTTVLYIFLSTIFLYARCNHLGWRRLSITLALIPCLMAGYLIYNDEKVIPLAIIGSIFFYILGIWLVLGSRSIFMWVRSGFVNP